MLSSIARGTLHEQIQIGDEAVERGSASELGNERALPFGQFDASWQMLDGTGGIVKKSASELSVSERSADQLLKAGQSTLRLAICRSSFKKWFTHCRASGAHLHRERLG
jgi:hypothetical protein